MKPNLTLTLDRTIPHEDHPVRLALTLNGWLPREIDLEDEDVKQALGKALLLVQQDLLDSTVQQPTCSNCRFYEASLRECRRHGPTKDRWPIARAEEWCGDYQAGQTGGSRGG